MEIKQAQILILALVFALQFLFEHLYPQDRLINDWKNERYNILIGLMNLLVTFIPAGFFVQGLQWLESKNLGLLHQVRLPFWLHLLITVLVLDCWMYVWHRMNHRIGWLWHFHSFHHADKKMNSTTALRFHVAELFLSYPGKAMICFVFGISYLPLLVYEVLFFIAVIIHHSNMHISEKADALYRRLFASPLMHRIHHSMRWQETNSNFGALFSFWDRLFNSWTAKAKGEVIFGLPSEEQRVDERLRTKK